MADILTAASIDAIRPGDRRKEIPDGRVGGLYLVVQAAPSGSRSWCYRYRFDGVARKLTIGPSPALSLADARAAAKQAAADVAKHKDPAGEKRASRVAAKAKAAEQAKPLDLIDDAAERFLAAHGSKQKQLRPRTTKEVARLVRQNILPVWRGRRLSMISRADGKRLLNDIVRRAPVLANRVATVLMMFGKWAVEEEVVVQNPFAGLSKPAKEVSRDRVLDDGEIGALMTALKSEDFPLRPLVELLLITGQRRSEIAEMRRSEIDLDGKLWTLPKERAKNGREHTLPLPDDVVDILREVPRIDSSDLLFTANGVNAFTAFDGARNRLHAKMEATLGEPVEPWRLHDLRRTAASGMASLGIAPHVVEAVLNHKSGTIRGVASVYNRYSYRGEMLAALTAWSNRIREIASGEAAASNVVTFTKAV